MSNLQYIVRAPKKNIENPPLLVLLHGYGSNKEDLRIEDVEVLEDVEFLQEQIQAKIKALDESNADSAVVAAIRLELVTVLAQLEKAKLDLKEMHIML